MNVFERTALYSNISCFYLSYFKNPFTDFMFKHVRLKHFSQTLCKLDVSAFQKFTRLFLPAICSFSAGTTFYPSWWVPTQRIMRTAHPIGPTSMWTSLNRRRNSPSTYIGWIVMMICTTRISAGKAPASSSTRISGAGYVPCFTMIARQSTTRMWTNGGEGRACAQPTRGANTISRVPRVYKTPEKSIARRYTEEDSSGGYGEKHACAHSCVRAYVYACVFLPDALLNFYQKIFRFFQHQNVARAEEWLQFEKERVWRSWIGRRYWMDCGIPR